METESTSEKEIEKSNFKDSNQINKEEQSFLVQFMSDIHLEFPDVLNNFPPFEGFSNFIF